MKQTIELNNKVEIDLLKLVDTRLLVQANSGGGKSWLLRRILEQSHGKIQQIVLDPEGEFGTLREKFDYVLASKGGDTPAEPRSAALLARKLLELGVSAIVDLYELPPQERKHFVRLFLDAMVDAPKELWKPVMVVLDEAHVFAPEKGVSEASSAVIDLATRGRKRGYGLILATQRISKLAKDAAAECNNKLIGRTGQDIDMKRASEELGFTSREQFYSLRSLKPGEFFSFGPAISTEVIQVEVGAVQTTHPKAGSRTLTRVAPPTAGIKKILGKLADLPAEAKKEAATVAEFKNEIKNLRHELSIAKRQAPPPSKEKLEALVKSAVDHVDREWRKKYSELSLGLSALTTALQNINRTSGAALETHLRKTVKTAGKVLVKKVREAVIQNPDILAPVLRLQPKPHGAPMGQAPQIEEVNEKDIGICAKKVYSFLHQNQHSVRGFTKVQLGAVTGYSPKSGGFNNAIAALNSRGLIQKVGELIRIGTIEEQYLIDSEDYTPELWFSKLGACEKKIYRLLWDNPQVVFTKEEVGEQTGYSHTSGGFNNAVSRLSSIGLLQRENGGLTLNPELTNL